MDSIRVAICDDLERVRTSLALYLEADAALHVVGSYPTGHALLEGLQLAPADVMLLDFRMPGMDGHAVAQRLATSRHRCRVLYLTSYPDEVPLEDALTGVVAGALSKDIPPDDLIRAVYMARSGTAMVSPSILARYRPSPRPDERREEFAIDAREREILRLLFLGMTNQQMASRMGRSASSVKQILSGMCARAGVSSRTELVLKLLGE